jgi:uncharacterized protein (DUF608 family)
MHIRKGRSGSERIYTHQDTEANFPLGGIGTGTISIDSRGRLNDFELFNKPDKGNDMPYSFFALHTEPEDSKESSGSSGTPDMGINQEVQVLYTPGSGKY